MLSLKMKDQHIELLDGLLVSSASQAYSRKPAWGDLHSAHCKECYL